MLFGIAVKTPQISVFFWFRRLKVTCFFLVDIMWISVFLLLHSWKIWIVKWPSKRHHQNWNELRFLAMKLRVESMSSKQASCLYLLPTFLLPLRWTYFKATRLMNLKQSLPNDAWSNCTLVCSTLAYEKRDCKLLLQFYCSPCLVLWPVRGSFRRRNVPFGTSIWSYMIRYSHLDFFVLEEDYPSLMEIFGASNIMDPKLPRLRNSLTGRCSQAALSSLSDIHKVC